MKKRKSPYALLSILIVLVGVSFVMGNRMMRITSGEPQQEAPVEELADSGPVKAPATEQLANIAKGGMTAARPALRGGNRGREGNSTLLPRERSTVLMPAKVKYKPTRSESTPRSLRGD